MGLAGWAELYGFLFVSHYLISLFLVRRRRLYGWKMAFKGFHFQLL